MAQDTKGGLAGGGTQGSKGSQATQGSKGTVQRAGTPGGYTNHVWWDMHTSGTSDTLSLGNIQSYHNWSVGSLSPRCRVDAEWTDSTPGCASTPRAADEEPDTVEYLIRFQTRPSRYLPEYNGILTWERWCCWLGPDGNVEQAYGLLKSLARGQYRLWKHSKKGNILYFKEALVADKVAQEFAKAVGEEVVS